MRAAVLYAVPAADTFSVQLGQFVDKMLFFPFPVSMAGYRGETQADGDAKQKPHHIDPSFSNLQSYYAYPTAYYIQLRNGRYRPAAVRN